MDIYVKQNIVWDLIGILDLAAALLQVRIKWEVFTVQHAVLEYHRWTLYGF